MGNGTTAVGAQTFETFEMPFNEIEIELLRMP